ncbi:MAG: glycoside hydrolase, partial [Calditrichaeota bacterium]|nr:glycoside hydrolase [Calditrichota bacterium]
MFFKNQKKRFTNQTISLLFTAFYFLLSVLPVYALQTGIYNVTDFGAAADGKTLDTKAIQAAVDSCSQSGGGTVFFPAGTYLTGTIYLKNHVRLNLDAGALVLGS